MLPHAETYEACRAAFRWQVPARFNIAAACLDRHAADAPEATALILDDGRADAPRVTFARLREEADRFANVLGELGLGPGDRVAIHLPQGLEAAVAHLGTYKAGAIALPLFSLFGPDALAHRLADSGAALIVTSLENLARLAPVRDGLGALRHILTVDGEAPGTRALAPLMARAAPRFETRDTAADDPALIIYTSGTTGPPKGALHAHRVLLGHLPGVEFPHEFLPRPGDLMWTPADWAWIGGLLDVLLPALYHRVPVLARRLPRFDPGEALALMARHGVRNVFMPATALRLLREGVSGRVGQCRLRTIGSGGETLGADLIDWGRQAFGVTINEFYGQTEVNLVVGNNAAIMPVRPGSMGRAIPGHDVAVIDGEGRALPPGTEGLIAVRRPDPVMFLGYWRNEAATARKFVGDWCVLGDLGTMDADGYFHFKSRDDDVISSAGYRIGPGEVEASLMRHPAVALAGVIGSPDAVRGEIVKAYVVLRPGFAAGDALAATLKAHVRDTLAAHEYPRELRFIAEMPLTVTGKIRRMDLRAMDRAERGG
ncbi:MAG: acyl-CoA synthetase [Hyphomicrobiaceae bacterium]